jgi:hypothetical protein
VAVVAALAASAQAEHHALRQRLFHRRPANNGLPTIYSTVTPSSSAVPSSIVAPSPVSSPVSVPLGTGAVGSQSAGSGATSDVVVTYTLGTGTSTSVVTTTIHRTATNEHTVYAVCIQPPADLGLH